MIKKKRQKYVRDSEGKFTSIAGAAKKVVKNSAGRKRLSVAGGKSVSLFVGGTKRATNSLFKKKKARKKK